MLFPKQDICTGMVNKCSEELHYKYIHKYIYTDEQYKNIAEYEKKIDVIITLDSVYVDTIQEYPNEELQIQQLYWDELNKIIHLNNDNDNNKKKKALPTITATASSLSSTQSISIAPLIKYINKISGPKPVKYTNVFEEWEGYDDCTMRLEYEILHEDFCKGGGREEEAITKEYKE
ncbi:unnamed protein product [Cunninghamella blakesleeana]